MPISVHAIKKTAVVVVLPYKVHGTAAMCPELEVYRPERWSNSDQQPSLTKYSIVPSQGLQQRPRQNITVVVPDS
ncbi:hypothetical protein GQ53DRAFT_80601 [Thozetella sp. PMI_491]|nr:hypothetical protein GQ53DRAFT_80601 [Thozetella sp. PMI_491]